MRLIDADAIKYTMLQKFVKGALHEQQGIWKKDIDAQPTIDAVPVMHGEWSRIDKNGEYDYYNAHCTVCGLTIGAIGWSNEYETNYCPNCGAKMDGGDGDGT